jgi:acyltransferase
MKNKNITAIKGLAIIGVVFHHISNRRLETEPRAWISDLEMIFCWCVFAFFATAGWLHALKEEKQKQPIASFVVSRTRRLLVPFVLLILCYAAIWQGVQHFHLMALRGALSQSYLGKVRDSLWPVGENAVAEQLYFLPMLLGACIAAHLALRVAGRTGVIALGGACFATALFYYPHCADTGFSAGVALWGCFMYCCGFLLYPHPHNKITWCVLAGLAMFAVAVAGLTIWGKFAAVGLLGVAPIVRLPSIPLLVAIGDASGTIYIYHTPFILQPLMILAAKAHTPVAQFLCALAAAALAIAICSAIFFGLRNSRFQRLLM